VAGELEESAITVEPVPQQGLWPRPQEPKQQPKHSLKMREKIKGVVVLVAVDVSLGGRSAKGLECL